MERRTYHTAVHVFKIVHEIAPLHLHDMFHYALEITGRVGRNPLRLYVPSIRTNYRQGALFGTVVPQFGTTCALL